VESFGNPARGNAGGGWVTFQPDGLPNWRGVRSYASSLWELSRFSGGREQGGKRPPDARVGGEDIPISEAMKGYYTGYSPSILPRTSADKYLEALKTKGECSCKNVSSMGNSLIKDVPDPVVLSVSLTRQPCLHESKFCELNGETMEEEMSLKSKILTAMGMSEEAEVIALKSQVTTLEDKIDAMQTEFKEALKAQQEEFKQTLTEALKTAVEEEVVEEEADTEETTEEAAEVEVEEEVEETTEEEEVVAEKSEEEVVAEKGESKQEPVHDNIEAQKSKPKTVYELMGRYPNGVKIRK
jgi:hypothetical protein